MLLKIPAHKVEELSVWRHREKSPNIIGTKTGTLDIYLENGWVIRIKSEKIRLMRYRPTNMALVINERGDIVLSSQGWSWRNKEPPLGWWRWPDY